MILTKGQRNHLAKLITNGKADDHRVDELKPLRNLITANESGISRNYKKICVYLESEPTLIRNGRVVDIVREIEKIAARV